MMSGTWYNMCTKPCHIRSWAYFKYWSMNVNIWQLPVAMNAQFALKLWQFLWGEQQPKLFRRHTSMWLWGSYVWLQTVTDTHVRVLNVTVCVELGTHKTFLTHELHVTDTKLAKSTTLADPTIILEAHSCKTSVTKLASSLHTLCDCAHYEPRNGSLTVTWHHDITSI